jgi:hypothetical protein
MGWRSRGVGLELGLGRRGGMVLGHQGKGCCEHQDGQGAHENSDFVCHPIGKRRAGYEFRAVMSGGRVPVRV